MIIHKVALIEFQKGQIYPKIKNLTHFLFQFQIRWRIESEGELNNGNSFIAVLCEGDYAEINRIKEVAEKQNVKIEIV